jgi:dUTP pyrophosphatase
MKVNFKKIHKDAVTPVYAKPGDAAVDLTAVGVEETDDFIEYKLGIAVEIPEGHVGIMVARSSVTKFDLMMKNCVGIIDSGYRGELVIRFQRLLPFKLLLKLFRGIPIIHDFLNAHTPQIYNVGDRVAQFIILPYPKIEYEEAEKLAESVRGESGFGSSGK